MPSENPKTDRKNLKDEYLRTQHAARAGRMPLDAGQLEALLDHVDDAVRTDGCDHTLRAAEAWATRHRIDLGRLREGLEEYGGFCDCEVIMNVDADEVFTPPRRPGSGGRR